MSENQCAQCGRIMQKIGRHWYCKICDEDILYSLFIGRKKIEALKKREQSLTTIDGFHLNAEGMKTIALGVIEELRR